MRPTRPIMLVVYTTDADFVHPVPPKARFSRTETTEKRVQLGQGTGNGPTDGSPRTHSCPWGTRAYGVLRDVGRQGVSGMRRLRVRLMVVHWIPVLLVEFVWVAKNEGSPATTGEPKDVKLK